MCYTPRQTTREGVNYSFPCGHCPKCKRRRISAWTFRVMQEDKHADSAYFITLTYDSINVPITSNGYMGLSKRDVQLFFKRLRKLYGVYTRGRKNKNKNTSPKKPIKYYLCGEYGTKRKRPHYHAIIFNVQPELIEKAWQMGAVYYGTVTGASVGYTMKYMLKDPKIKHHENDDRLPQFQLMSKGLGKCYITNNMLAWHKADLKNRMYLNIEDGKKIAMPRYYKDKIYTSFERSIISGHLKQQMEQKRYEPLRYLETNKHHLKQLAEGIKYAFKRMNYVAQLDKTF